LTLNAPFPNVAVTAGVTLSVCGQIYFVFQQLLKGNAGELLITDQRLARRFPFSMLPLRDERGAELQLRALQS
jgi:hypothetical protein